VTAPVAGLAAAYMALAWMLVRAQRAARSKPAATAAIS
jgi:hypothetical protein